MRLSPMLERVKGYNWFQSSPPPRRGCAYRARITNRVRPSKFQSSPPPRRGCARCATWWTRSCGPCFNPHPLREGDAPLPHVEGRGVDHVSILTPSEKGMRPAQNRSILAWEGRCFNPHPLREGDAPGGHEAHVPVQVVSILTPSEKGMRQHILALLRGEGRQVSILTPSEKGMRPPSRPAFSPGPPNCFNPHPLREEDAPRGRRGSGVGGLGVSILTPSEKRMRPA